MELWAQWFSCVQELRPACARTKCFLWLVVVLAAMSIRADLAGVTSFVRSHWLTGKCYLLLLHFFHSSALDLDKLTQLWVKLVIKIFAPSLVRINDRLIMLADGIKAPKEGRKMPAVKSLHQESSCNSKPPFIMGHSCQTVSLLVKAGDQHVAVPLASRIHEGLVFTNRDCRTLLDKLMTMISDLLIKAPFYVVADRYYASQKIARPLARNSNHLICRLRINAVAFDQPPSAPQKGRGRPCTYGSKRSLKHLFERQSEMATAPSPVYGEQGIEVAYRCVDLLWRPVGKLVRFVAVDHPHRGKVLLMSTDLALDPMIILQLYGFRFKIEASFRQAVHTIGTYAYHFWMMDMVRIKRCSGDQHMHHRTETYRKAVRRKMDAYQRHIQIGVIVQGLLQYLAVAKSRSVWQHFRGWMRTMNTATCPSEHVVAQALRHTFPEFLLRLPQTDPVKEFLGQKLDVARWPGFRLAS